MKCALCTWIIRTEAAAERYLVMQLCAAARLDSALMGFQLSLPPPPPRSDVTRLPGYCAN